MSWSNGIRPELLPWFRWVVANLTELDGSTRVSSAFRTYAEQARLYRRYLAGQSRYPVAPPGSSYHEYGRAIDVVARPEALRRVGLMWRAAGGTWGGERDPIHFHA